MTRLLILILALPLCVAAAPTHTLFLDFDGAPANAFYFADTPPFAHPDQIPVILAYVAKVYAPFDLAVTTVDPGPLVDGKSAAVVVGGASFTPGEAGNSPIGGFTSPNLPNAGHVYSETIGDNVDWVKVAAAHEAGHLFGLVHSTDPNDIMYAVLGASASPTFSAAEAAQLGGVLGYAPVVEPGTALLVCGAVAVGCQRRTSHGGIKGIR